MTENEREIVFDDDAKTILERWGSGGPNVLCLHGMTSSRKSWERMAGALELAYTVWAYDMRGHGDAAQVEGPMTFERIVRDCEQVADAIPGGIDTLIGHSWGGAIAILGGIRMPVSRVIAIDPMFHEHGSRKGGGWERYWREQMESTLALRGKEREWKIMNDYHERPDIEIQAKIHALRSMTMEPLLAIGRDNGADDGKIDLRESIVNYPKPMLMLLADTAESVVHEEDVEFIGLHAGPNVAVRVFAGEGHSLHRTAFEETMKVVYAFLGTPR
jgi:pimeloyl-ACP methyl ester carboxylesterase